MSIRGFVEVYVFHPTCPYASKNKCAHCQYLESRNCDYLGKVYVRVNGFYTSGFKIGSSRYYGPFISDDAADKAVESAKFREQVENDFGIMLAPLDDPNSCLNASDLN